MIICSNHRESCGCDVPAETLTPVRRTSRKWGLIVSFVLLMCPGLCSAGSVAAVSTPSLQCYDLATLADLRLGLVGYPPDPILPFQGIQLPLPAPTDLAKLKEAAQANGIEGLTPVQQVFLAAMCHQERGACATFVKLSEKLHKLYPDEIIAMRLYSVALHSRGRYREAQVVYDRLMRSPVTSEYVQACVASGIASLIVDIEPEKAVSYSEFAVDQDELNGWKQELFKHLNNYAVILEQSGDSVRGKVFLDSSLVLARRDAVTPADTLLMISNLNYRRAMRGSDFDEVWIAAQNLQTIASSIPESHDNRVLAEVDDDLALAYTRLAGLSKSKSEKMEYLKTACSYSVKAMELHEGRGDYRGLALDSLRLAKILLQADSLGLSTRPLCDGAEMSPIVAAKSTLGLAEEHGYIQLAGEARQFIIDYYSSARHANAKDRELKKQLLFENFKVAEDNDLFGLMSRSGFRLVEFYSSYNTPDSLLPSVGILLKMFPSLSLKNDDKLEEGVDRIDEILSSKSISDEKKAPLREQIRNNLDSHATDYFETPRGRKAQSRLSEMCSN